MLDQLRMVFFGRLLRQTLAAQRRRRKTHTMESAHTIGILFDATAENDRRDILDLKRALEENQRKKVRILGFVDAKHPLGQTQFPQFTQKELRWNGKPKSEAVDAFLAEHIDLLLCLNKSEVPWINWVAAASRAGMKIGTATTAPCDFDMILETPTDQGIPFFMKQLDVYLGKIVPSKHEPASTL